MDPDVEMSIEGRLLLDGELVDGVVGITGGRIVAIKKVLEGDLHHDMSGHVVVPAAVDMHVHFRQPGDGRKGTFETESRAAAFGGVTTVADMPNTTPPAVDLRSWSDKLEEVRDHSFVDYVLYMGLSGHVGAERLGMATGLFKLYIASTTGDLLVRDLNAWANALASALEAGGRVVVHAEDQGVIEAAEPSGQELELHHTSRPPLGEAAAVGQVVRVALTTPAPGNAHVAHVSCREALAALGPGAVSSEVTPHHLFLDLRREELRAYGKVNPPLRTDSDRAALWAALAQGVVPVVASDHAPHTRAEKDRAFEEAPPGIPGVETMVPMLMAEVRSGRLGLDRLVDATATRPAAFLGLAKRDLGVGLEAHIAVYDTREVGEVDPDRLHHGCGWTPYGGRPSIFPKLVVSPGGVLVEDGVLQQSRPSGRYVGRTLEELRAGEPGPQDANSS